ncbi:uncharacterized protein LOC110449158 isoform X2 [Mizuhopecten yessoensis]|uniref:uncharacterized protein LOC110449158 isoform X2 n=1 Tax=Mizuhopecten yessoensis TaxID=6573 RepID=UPI000B45EEF4|nr:uncharacterized protein LOC110449158 isoform X2 [Mizuhopecten yessoensis]XP_021351511.1 uncharacterized protein LOC110449158 isoform X2 [Mizuhopecten yessoensis]
MEEYTKLGVMDFGQSIGSPNEYKNDLDLLVSSSLESGYGSPQQSASSKSSSFDNSSEFDSLSSEEQSLTTENNHDDSSSQEEDVIANNIERGDCFNDLLQPKPSKCVNDICSTEKMNSAGCSNGPCDYLPTQKYPIDHIEKIPIQEEFRSEITTFCHKIPRTESLDIVEETAISIDMETNLPNGFDHFDSPHPKVPIQIVSQETHDTTKIRCTCKTHPTLQRSEVKRRGMDTEWLCLETRLHGHFISDCSQEIQQRLKLKNGDRLMSVNEEDVHNLSHHVIVQKTNDVIHMETKETKQTLVIERHRHREDDGECFDFYRIEIQLEFLEEDGGNTLVDVTSRLLIKLVRSFSVIYNLECDGKRKCWISHYTNRTDKYLCPGNENPDTLVLGHLPSNEDPKFQFSWCQYHGFRKDGNENVELFLLTLTSKDTDGFICVGTKGNVRLKRYEYEPEKMTSIANPLPYLFICQMYKDGSYNLESLNHEGWFLRWNEDENKMDIQQRDKKKNQPDFLFHIYTDPSRVRPSVPH